ncbi:tlde1 domain-containing protein [Mesorhizobium sp. M1322]|uniref:tlde1 domain-containing protein n=1 Tax=Mesorhizobium sp. M1322 TaxID=2957081 RepID=UPI003335A034
MRPGRRWAAIPVVGVVIALWSVATVAGLHSVGTSLTTASNSLPQSLLAPRSMALADPRHTVANSWANSWASSPAPSLAASRQRQAALLSRCDAGCAQAAASFVHEGKMARLKPLAKPNTVPVVAEISPQARFDSVVAKAALSPQKLAAAFARASGAGAPFAVASVPTGARFAEPVRLPDQHGPAAARFGPEIAESERSSRLALALANALPEEMIDVLPPAVAASEPASSQEPQGAEVQGASLPPQDDMPDSIPLPTFRSRAEIDQSEAPEVEAPTAKTPKVQASKPAKAQSQPPKSTKAPIADAPQVEMPRAPALSPRSSSPAAMPSLQAKQGSPGMQGSPGVQGSRGKPAKRSKAADMLAYAKPDSPAGGGAFRNLFTKPGSGVAVYDISSKTVYMPDGSRLEAHSGLGSMADQPRYANRKNAGPTPPHTYDLRLRESRFHGVEALRLTPIDGKNKFGRDGFLAHTYLLRGRRGESSGCVVFKDYARFLAAFKKGKIKRLVVRG